MSKTQAGEIDRPTSGLWTEPAPGKLIGPGHRAGDLLEAHDWDVLESREGLLRVRAYLPSGLKNPRGHLFGGFTPTYVDFMGIHTFWAGREARPGHPWLATVNMRVDYFAPVRSESFEIEGRILNRRTSMCWMETRFFDPEGELTVYAYTTFRLV